MKRGGGGGFTVSRTRSLVQGASGGRGRVRWATSVRRPTRDLDLSRPPFLASSPLRCRPVHSTPREERTGEPSSPIPPSGSSTHQPSTTRTLTRSRLRCVVSFSFSNPEERGGQQPSILSFIQVQAGTPSPKILFCSKPTAMEPHCATLRHQRGQREIAILRQCRCR